jgi:hypothetical protein
MLEDQQLFKDDRSVLLGSHSWKHAQLCRTEPEGTGRQGWLDLALPLKKKNALDQCSCPRH